MLCKKNAYFQLSWDLMLCLYAGFNYLLNFPLTAFGVGGYCHCRLFLLSSVRSSVRLVRPPWTNLRNSDDVQHHGSNPLLNQFLRVLRNFGVFHDKLDQVWGLMLLQLLIYDSRYQPEIWWHDALCHECSHYSKWPSLANVIIIWKRPVEHPTVLCTSCKVRWVQLSNGYL